MPRGGPDWGLYAPQKSFEQLLREGNAFGHEGFHPGQVDLYAGLQLWNPADSLVDALIYRIDYVTGAASWIDIQLGTTEFITDKGAGSNRRAGMAASDLHVRLQSAAALAGTPLLMDYNDGTVMRPIYPCYIWIPPGTCCNLTVRTKATQTTTHWWWFEFVSEEI